MKILFLSSTPVGGPVDGMSRRIYHLLKALSRQGDVTLACPSPIGGAPADKHTASDLCAAVHNYGGRPYGVLRTNHALRWVEWKLRYLHPLPLELQFARSKSGKKLVSGLSPESYDLVWVERLQTLQLLPPFASTPVVVDLDDIYSQRMATRLRRGRLYRGIQFDLLEYLKWRRLEKRLHRYPYTFVVCSEEGRKWLDARTRVGVIPNGIELPKTEYGSVQDTARPTFLFSGVMSYAPNIDAVLHFRELIWPRILSRLPSARFLIVGRDPDPAVQRLHNGDSVIVTGTVPDTASYFRQANAMVVPLRMGSGTRIKILEAWARRLPVVSTAFGAEGLGAENGKNLLMADSPAEFAAACVRLLQDTKLSDELSRAGYEHVQEHFTWEKIEQKVQAIANAAMAGYHPPPEFRGQRERDSELSRTLI